MPGKPPSQLDFMLQGKRNPVAQLKNIQQKQRAFATRSSVSALNQEIETDARPNQAQNASFEQYNNGATVPLLWTKTGTVVLNKTAVDADGPTTVSLTTGGSLSQTPQAAVNISAGAVVVSVEARTSDADQHLSMLFTHSPGFNAGILYRLSPEGTVDQTDEVPADGNWYRFYQSWVVVGGASITYGFQQSGSAGSIELDAVKFEQVVGETLHIEPTNYVSTEWGPTSQFRAIYAGNITTGSLTVGGSNAANPRISVLDNTDTEIVTIGDPTNGFLGIDVKSGAGIRVTGTGSITTSLTGSALNITNKGLYLTNATSGQAFGVSSANGVSWGGKTLDAGDLLIGRSTSYVFWDDSAATLTLAADGSGLTNINGANIQTGTITANKLSVSQLSAIAADMGSLTAGSIVVGTTNKLWLNDLADGALNIGGTTKASAPFRVTAAGALSATNATITGAITATSGSLSALSISGALTFGTGAVLKAGMTAYNTGTGFWLEYNAGTPRLSIGNAGGNKLTWDGTSLSVNGTHIGDGSAVTNLNGANIQPGTVTTGAILVTLGSGNLLYNSNFASSSAFDGWVNTYGGATVTDSLYTLLSTDPSSPVGSLQVWRSVTSGADVGGYSRKYVSGFIPVDITQPYTLSGWFRRVSGTVSCLFGLLCYDATNTLLGVVNPTNATNNVPGGILIAGTTIPTTWTRYGGTVTPASFPAGTKTVKVQVYANYHPVASGQEVWVDGIQLERGDVATSWNPNVRELLPGTITADRLNVSQLSAIAADLGSLTAGSIVIGTTNKLWFNDLNDGAINVGGTTKASAPFRVSAAGALVATNATITGQITATSATLSGALTVQTSGYIASGATAFLAGNGIWLDNVSAGVQNFRVGSVSAGALVKGLSWNGTDLVIQSQDFTLDATGRLTIGQSNNVVVASPADATYRLWVGNATAASAPFRVDKTGAMTATNATITGAITASSGSITGSLSVSGSLVMGNNAVIRSGKTSASDNAQGYYLGRDASGVTTFAIGSQPSGQNFIYYDGTHLNMVADSISLNGGYIGSLPNSTFINGPIKINPGAYLSMDQSPVQFNTQYGDAGIYIGADPVNAYASMSVGQGTGGQGFYWDSANATFSGYIGFLNGIMSFNTWTNTVAIRNGQTAYNTGSGFNLEKTAAGVNRVSFGAGGSGQRLTYDGTAMTFKGTIDTSTLTGLSTFNSGAVQVALSSGQSAYSTGTGFFFENTAAGVTRVSIGTAAGARLTWDGTTMTTGALTFDGTIAAAATTGALAVHSTAYNTGNGLWAGNNAGNLQFSLGSTAGNRILYTEVNGVMVIQADSYTVAYATANVDNGGIDMNITSKWTNDSTNSITISKHSDPLTKIFSFVSSGSVFTDRTAVWNEAVGTSIALPVAVGDMLYFGHTTKTSLNGLRFVFGTFATGAYTYIFEYWNGTAWTSVNATAGFSESATGFTANNSVVWNVNNLTGWTANTINAQNAFWVRLRITAAGTGTPAAFLMSTGGYLGAFTRFLNANVSKFEVRYDGRVVTAGSIYPGSTIEGGTFQTSRFIADDPTNSRLLSSGDWYITGNEIVKGATQIERAGILYSTTTLIPLTVPLTTSNTAYNGTTTISTIAKTVINLNTQFAVPAGAKAVLLRVQVKDTASATTDALVYLSPNNTAASGIIVGAATVNSRYGRDVVLVPTDGSGNIYYQTVASGAGTMTLELQVWGYCL